ncbi:TetR/AcrR family transcriptional regulator [Pulveribacter sp.]|uniref:TetR/AcrR family transcriptional regulator n=1 Tax=Pulveribacter sp. TaxID=2678893 RepID=UPI0028AEBDFA|nr:TetR/AcrR family transcriptional regulator [Pulveribacter sp.]
MKKSAPSPRTAPTAAPARWNNALAATPDPHALRKRALILAAGRVFGDKGFHNTTLDDIASALSVTKPALYRYVQNKHEILYECHRMAVGLAEEALEQARQLHADAPLQALRSFVALYIRKMTSELGTCVMLTEYYSMTAEHNERIQQRRRVIDRGLRDMVAQAVERGDIAPCDPKFAVFFIMGAINNINRWFSDQGPAAGPDIAETFADFALQSLKPTA